MVEILGKVASGHGSLSVAHVLAVVRALVDAWDGIFLDESAARAAVGVGGGHEEGGRYKRGQCGEGEFLHHISIREMRENLSENLQTGHVCRADLLKIFELENLVVNFLENEISPFFHFRGFILEASIHGNSHAKQ